MDVAAATTATVGVSENAVERARLDRRFSEVNELTSRRPHLHSTL